MTARQRGGAHLARPIGVRFTLAALAAMLLFALPANAQSNGVLIISNDRGGVIGQRAKQIRDLRNSGQSIEIRGRVCLSSCTMYLGLPSTCIHPDTVFGFHGPSYYGTPLSPGDFEYWSHVIAAHYPEPLRRWYLETGRTRTAGHFRIRGRELIRLGIKRC
ncbi:hypothetical protein [Aliiroseovarius sp. YM-037]|uniref:hypothetical protein n=1 Tax=Aliiroseovarius sp. YM-037 TaxID=3341728 RepID=UPI003A80682B